MTPNMRQIWSLHVMKGWSLITVLVVISGTFPHNTIRHDHALVHGAPGVMGSPNKAIRQSRLHKDVHTSFKASDT